VNPKLKRLLTNLGISLVATLLTLVVLELVARVVLPPPKFDPLLPLYPFTRHIYNVNLPGVAPVIHHSTNEWGFRGDAPPRDWDNTYTIVTVGGSTTQCFYLDDTKTWPALLQADLRASNPRLWVGNAGLDGHSTRGHLLVMDQVIRQIRPKAVIVLAGINDLAISLSESERVNGRAWDESFKVERRAILNYSQLYQLLLLAKRQLIDGVPAAEQGFHQAFPRIAVKPEELAPLPGDLTTLLPSLPEYRRNLNRLIDMAQAMNVRVLFLTQPMMFDDTPYWRGIQGEMYWLKDQTIKISAATYWRMLSIYNQTLLDVCRERNVPCYDLASHIPHSDQYFYDAVHFNEAGAALVASEVDKAVRQYLLPQ